MSGHVPIRCLVVSPSEVCFQQLAESLRRAGPQGHYHWCRNLEECRRALSGEPWDAVVTDVSQTAYSAVELQASNEQLVALAESLRFAREEEAARIAREIHDELGSALTILRWDLEEVGKAFGVAGPPAVRERIASMTKLIDGTIHSVRRISSELRPGILDDLGLVGSIEWQAQQFQSRSGIVCQCDALVEQVDLTRGQVAAIFGVLQEALTNILRHAQASRVNITLEVEEGEFVLEVRDNGKGISEKAKSDRGSLGLLGMRERAQLAGGRLDIEALAPRGTVVTFRVPITSESRD